MQVPQREPFTIISKLVLIGVIMMRPFWPRKLDMTSHKIHTIYLSFIENMPRATDGQGKRATLDTIKSYVSNIQALVVDLHKTESVDAHICKLILQNLRV